MPPVPIPMNVSVADYDVTRTREVWSVKQGWLRLFLGTPCSRIVYNYYIDADFYFRDDGGFRYKLSKNYLTPPTVYFMGSQKSIPGIVRLLLKAGYKPKFEEYENFVRFRYNASRDTYERVFTDLVAGR